MDMVAVKPAAAARGAVTRGALLDAAEALVADQGYRQPSHRTIARAAAAHPALVNYHFGSKEMLFEAALERRAARLNAAWDVALRAVQARPARTVEDVLAAWWQPFADSDHHAERSWSNYLCIVARLASAADGEAWRERHFGRIDRAFLDALTAALPGARREDVDAGFRYARILFGEVLLVRCGRSGGSSCAPGFRDGDVGRLIRYLASGLRGLARTIAAAAD